MFGLTSAGGLLQMGIFRIELGGLQLCQACSFYISPTSKLYETVKKTFTPGVANVAIVLSAI